MTDLTQLVTNSQRIAPTRTESELKGRFVQYGRHRRLTINIFIEYVKKSPEYSDVLRGFFMTLFQAILALDSSEKVRHVDLLVDHGTEL